MRILGITIPNNKHLDVGLTCLYGIGISRARKILDEAVKDGTLTKEEAKKFDIESNGRFMTNLKGRSPLTRAQALREFGIDHSEQIPEQEYKFVSKSGGKVPRWHWCKHYPSTGQNYFY